MPTPPTSVENTLGPYRLLRQLGQGGMGTVYLAHDDALNRPVAIKILRSAAEESSRAAAARARRFLREAQSAASLNHPNVVTIHSTAHHAGAPYIVMEYIPGGSLAEHLRDAGPMPWRSAAAALCDALRALAAAHHAGIVHRDIKPANLMLARDSAGAPLIKLADFGLARANLLITGDHDLTFPGAFVGSPSYAAPEQIAGALHIDGRADLYSLAATAFALLTGQPPFVEEDPADLMDRHLHAPFPELSAFISAAPSEFQSLLARASQKKPQDRFPSATDMLAAAESLLKLPPDLPHPARAGSASFDGPAIPAAHRSSAPASRATDTLIELESRLADARRQSDSSTQLATLRALAGLYSQLHRPADARRSSREALALHIKLCAPTDN